MRRNASERDERHGRSRHPPKFLGFVKLILATLKVAMTEEKNQAFDARVSKFDRVCPTSHDTQQQAIEFCVRSVILGVVGIFGGRTDTCDIKKRSDMATVPPRTAPHFAPASFGRNISSS